MVLYYKIIIYVQTHNLGPRITEFKSFLLFTLRHAFLLKWFKGRWCCSALLLQNIDLSFACYRSFSIRSCSRSLMSWFSKYHWGFQCDGGFFPLIHSSREPRGNVKPFLFSGWHPHDVCHPAPWNPPRGELPAAPSHDVCVCVCVCKKVKGIMKWKCNESTLLPVNTKHSPDPVTQCVSPFSPSRVDDLGWKFKFQLVLEMLIFFFFLSRGSMNSVQQNKHVRVELNPLNTHCSIWIIQALYEPQSSAVCCVVIISLFLSTYEGKDIFLAESYISKIKRERLLVSCFFFFRAVNINALIAIS